MKTGTKADAAQQASLLSSPPGEAARNPANPDGLVETEGADGKAEIIVKKSRFIAEVFRITDAQPARALVREQKARYADASHVVFAFVAGTDGSIRGLSDDGEPSGTSGRTVMDVLTGRNITNILLTVTRYFGGTLLGTGGLVKAYGDAAKAVLALCTFTPAEKKIPVCARMPYEYYERCVRLLETCGAQNIACTFETDVTVRCTLPESLSARFAREITDVTDGRGRMETTPPL
jgi:uncharacterized YigZ family protein